jgi:anti-sigma factor (TIGR02949 family)
MDCDECRERLDPYLDRELSPREFEEMRVHLDECGGCERAYVVERVLVERIKDSATASVAPEGVRERLIVRLRKDVGRRI